MNIGIDIDGVLTDVRAFMIEKGTKYCKETNKGSLVDPDSFSMRKMFDWDKETDTDFWKKNIFVYAKENPVIEGASKNIKKLKEAGYKIYIITARRIANTDENIDIDGVKDPKISMRNTVKEWLFKNDIIYDEIIFSGEDKAKHIIQNKIDIMIEASPKNLKSLSKLTKMICVDWPYNRDISNDNIYRCYNWWEIYETIRKISNQE